MFRFKDSENRFNFRGILNCELPEAITIDNTVVMININQRMQEIQFFQAKICRKSD